MRRIILTLLAALVAAVALGGVAIATSSGSSITKPRLERSLTASFGNAYTQEAAILGHRGVSPASLRAQAMCDKGPGVAQSGPGTSWNCLMSWSDPANPMPKTGYGKFELSVHSNGCYTVGSPSSLIGYQTITSARGRTVNNPAYVFDACLDPDSDSSPTGVSFPSALTVTSTTAILDQQRHPGLDLACGVGDGGCTGSVTATAGGHGLGSVRFDLSEQATKHLTFPGTVPAGSQDVTYTVTTTAGVAPSPADLPVQG